MFLFVVRPLHVTLDSGLDAIPPFTISSDERMISFPWWQEVCPFSAVSWLVSVRAEVRKFFNIPYSIVFYVQKWYTKIY